MWGADPVPLGRTASARKGRSRRMSSYQKSVDRAHAAALFASKWWLGRDAREIARFQLFTRELTLPFSVFHRAVEAALGRPVWVHEFGFNVDGLIHEFLGEADPPTLEEILGLVRAVPSLAVVAEEDPDAG
jgi:hypothetical protein